MRSAHRSIFLKCGRSICPNLDKLTFPGLRWNNRPPSFCSNRTIAFDSEGCDTPQRLAAPVKVRSWQIARKYRTDFKFTDCSQFRGKIGPKPKLPTRASQRRPDETVAPRDGNKLRSCLGPCHHPGIIRGGYEQRINPNRADQSREQHEQYGSVAQNDRQIAAVESARRRSAHPKGKRRRHDLLQFVRRLPRTLLRACRKSGRAEHHLR
jgi:hypothetical protein